MYSISHFVSSATLLYVYASSGKVSSDAPVYVSVFLSSLHMETATAFQSVFMFSIFCGDQSIHIMLTAVHNGPVICEI
jgi:hypothetical protein